MSDTPEIKPSTMISSSETVTTSDGNGEYKTETVITEQRIEGEIEDIDEEIEEWEAENPTSNELPPPLETQSAEIVEAATQAAELVEAVRQAEAADRTNQILEEINAGIKQLLQHQSALTSPSLESDPPAAEVTPAEEVTIQIREEATEAIENPPPPEPPAKPASKRERRLARKRARMNR